jgi:uncharacterized protein YgbK (DUF1537 family)
LDGAVGAPPHLRILGLADDLTGAVALGAELAGGGLACVVVHGDRVGVATGTSAVVVDTRTRRLDPEAAIAALGAVVRAVSPRIGPGTIVIKRIDSGLRGPWSAELAELSTLLDRRVIAATAAPAIGASVERGVQHLAGTRASMSHFAVDGEASGSDTLLTAMPGPAMSVPIEELLEPTVSEAVGALLRQYRSVVCDGRTTGHLVAASRAILASGGVIAVMTYGLGRALAQGIADEPARHVAEWSVPRSPVLALIGSDKPMTARQVDHARSAGWTVVAAVNPDAELDVATRLKRGERVVLEVGGGRSSTAREARYAILVAGIGARLAASLPTARLIIVGGETASAFAAAADIVSIQPLVEPWPTIAMVRMQSRSAGSMVAIVKSGSQGDAWWLVHAADVLAAWGEV